jgi:4-amino-4-deoxy-L-arabinose transferase-like glycosyltransferase
MPRTNDPRPERARDLRLALWIFLAALGARIAYLVLKAPLLTADGSYYYAVARSLADGRGFTVAYVWHYLAGIPARLPTPSNDYWMPLTSILEAGALKLGGGASLVAASMPGLVAGAALAAFVFWLTKELFGSTRAALLAAAMWGLSAHLVALSASPDCFMIAALLTSLGLYAIHRAGIVRAGTSPGPALGASGAAALPHRGWTVAAGVLAGLAYLARSDGALVAATFALLWIVTNRRCKVKDASWRALAWYAGAFLVVAAPWWLRNWMAFGRPLGAPAGKTAFLATYNDIFQLRASALTLQDYLALNQTVQGLMKGYVAWREVRLLAVMCGLALPFAAWAALRHPRRRLLSPWLAYSALAIGVTAFIFPYPALKGAFWHLAPGLCVFILAAGAAGVVQASERLWQTNRAPARFAAVTLPAAAVGLLAAWYAFTPAHGDVDRSPYRRAAGGVASLREPVRVAVTDDAWSLHCFTGLRCAQVPTDGVGAVLRVADALGANYLLVRERTLRNIAAVAAVQRCRRFEPAARWGTGGDAVYAYRVVPFARAEAIAKSRNARGMALAAAGRFDDAVAAFEAAASYKPDFAPIIANIALACWQAGRRQEAYLRAAQAVALDPENPTAKRILKERGR